MPIISPGWTGHRQPGGPKLPPGQHRVTDFPVLSAGPTPRVDTRRWQLTITTETGQVHTWDWKSFQQLPSENITVDLHCVTKWSKLGTGWRGVSLDTLLDGVQTSAQYAMARSYGGYTTNLPLRDLLDGQAWIAFRYGGADLTPEHGGPARLLVPHLYLWKSAKWLTGIDLMTTDTPGFWESLGYHNYGDPWREQRYEGD
jgi:DMSO/TMAO reductase YedYZ molybdopterin-dependent catalytic subunit